MFDEDLEPRKQKSAPKNLENMSVDELEEYIEELKAEIVRVEDDIDKKKGSLAAADSVFKS